MKTPEMTIGQACGLIFILFGMSKVVDYLWPSQTTAPLWFLGAWDIAVGLIIYAVSSWFSARKVRA